MRILVAPDKFKGALSAREVSDNIAAGLREILSDAKIDIVPMADGGEGTAEAIRSALSGSWMKCKAHDPLGREIDARYAYIDTENVGIIEMSEASGMCRLQPNERDVDLANTFGVGEMIWDAAKHGAKRLIVGLGGSATNDGGFGMARKLGFRFFGRDRELTGVVSELVSLTRLERPKNLSLPKVVGATDVRNPLLGESGATRVFGPQKGANEEKIEILERALSNLANVVAAEFGFDYRDQAGAGAAGGLGFGLTSFCGATLRPGFDIVAETVGLESKMQDVDLVITGEGSLDRQTLEGKTPDGVARMARRLGKRVYAIVGRADEDRQVREIFDRVYVAGEGIRDDEAIPRAAELLRASARKLANEL